MQKEDFFQQAEVVKMRLYQSYGKRLSGVLLGTWFQVEVFGEAATKKLIEKATFYRHLKLLVKAGVIWDGKYRYLNNKRGVEIANGNS